MVVVTGDYEGPFPDDMLYPHTDDKWRELGYYVTAVFKHTDDNTTIVVGNGFQYLFIDQTYYNSPLDAGINYRVFIRLYSRALNAVSICCCCYIMLLYCVRHNNTETVH